MSLSIEESLIKAIKNDDKKEFDALMEKASCETFRLGRFPVLSLMYLYKSRKMLSSYEEKFLKNTNYKVFSEPVEISKKFSAKAGKCLRLFLNEVVSPQEMLLILDRTRHLKRIYPLSKQSKEIKERLKSIYFIKYSLTVKFDGDEILIDRRPLSYREKKNIATICLSSVLLVSVAVGVPVTTVALIPKPVEGEVTKLDHIDFNSQKVYNLKQDIVIPENYFVEKVNCTINGEGNKLIFSKGSSLGTLNGKITDLTIENYGNAVFTSVSEKAAIECVTVNVNASVTAAEGTALVAETNYGTIDNITVNISGTINTFTESVGNTELIIGGIVQNNNYKFNSATQTVQRGVIKNCTVNYSQFELFGNSSANAAFGGIAGINSGYLQDCTVTGEIIADTFDIAGICSVNNGLLSSNINEANLSQTSNDVDWNPITCGIVLNNAYAIENCENKGKITSVSDCGQFEMHEEYEATASAVGIAYFNRGTTTTPYIINCINSGNIEADAKYRNTYTAGICISSNGEIESCKNKGIITSTADNEFDTNTGGITAIAYGNIYKSVNEGSVSAIGNGTAYIGGITARSCTQLTYCFSGGDISVTAREVYAGGILGFNEVTSYGYYVYCGTADYCISENRIKVALISEANAYIGGIAGYVSEAGFGGEPITYFGGAVNNCYFLGEYISDVSYFGNIAGVCGANIYENNSYNSGIFEYHNFEGNYYIYNSLKAFGATVSDDGGFTDAEDKGATVATLDEIQSNEAYKFILNLLNK